MRRPNPTGGYLFISPPVTDEGRNARLSRFPANLSLSAGRKPETGVFKGFVGGNLKHMRGNLHITETSDEDLNPVSCTWKMFFLSKYRIRSQKINIDLVYNKDKANS